MSSDARRAASARNGCLSHGPTSHEGIQRSKYNNLQHGRRASSEVLPWENGESLDALRERWHRCAQPQDDVEAYLCEKNVLNAWNNERAAYIAHELTVAEIEEAPIREQAEVERLGRHLFWNRTGPIQMLGLTRFVRGEEQASWSGNVDDPDVPSELVKKLESSAAGCSWLLRNWGELEARFKNGQPLLSHDRFRLIRMLGHEMLDALTNERIALVFLAAYSLHPPEGTPFDDLLSDMGKKDLVRFVAQIRLQWGRCLTPADTAKARKTLSELFSGTITRLKARLELHQERADDVDYRKAVQVSFDKSPDGEKVRRHVEATSRTFARGLDSIGKYRKTKAAAEAKPPRSNGNPRFDDLRALNATIDTLTATLAKERAALAEAEGCEVEAEEASIQSRGPVTPTISPRESGSELLGVFTSLAESILAGEIDEKQVDEIIRQMVPNAENLTDEPRKLGSDFSSQVVVGIAAGQGTGAHPVVKSDGPVVKSEQAADCAKNETMTAKSEPCTEPGGTAPPKKPGEGTPMGTGDHERAAGPPFASRGIDAKASAGGVEPRTGRRMSSAMKRRQRKEREAAARRAGSG